MIRVLIIDDEKFARKRISMLVNKIDDLRIVAECRNGQQAVKCIKELKPDLIYLDIEMKDMTGFDVLNEIDSDERPIVIFVTAYNEFALKAFENYALDYLLKPFDDERFFTATKNAKDIIWSKTAKLQLQHKIANFISTIQTNESIKLKEENRFPIKSNGKISLLSKNEIKYICASSYYSEIYHKDKKYILRETMGSLLAKLNSPNFLRIHRSTIVNIDFVDELMYNHYGEMDVQMQDAKVFRVSKAHKKELIGKIGIN